MLLQELDWWWLHERIQNITSKFQVVRKSGGSWQDISGTVECYHKAKEGQLRLHGYTPKLAGELFYSFRPEQVKGLTVDQLYLRGVQLYRRMTVPHRVSEAEFATTRPWVYSIISKRASQLTSSILGGFSCIGG